jgi:hypothetical protein
VPGPPVITQKLLMTAVNAATFCQFVSPFLKKNRSSPRRNSLVLTAGRAAFMRDLMMSASLFSYSE